MESGRILQWPVLSTPSSVLTLSGFFKHGRSSHELVILYPSQLRPAARLRLPVIMFLMVFSNLALYSNFQRTTKLWLGFIFNYLNRQLNSGLGLSLCIINLILKYIQMKPCRLTVLLKTQYWECSIEDAVLRTQYWGRSIEDAVLRTQYWGRSIMGAVLRMQYWGRSIEDAVLRTQYWGRSIMGAVLRMQYWGRSIEDAVLRTHYWGCSIKNVISRMQYWGRNIVDAILRTQHWGCTIEDSLLRNSTKDIQYLMSNKSINFNNINNKYLTIFFPSFSFLFFYLEFGGNIPTTSIFGDFKIFPPQSLYLVKFFK